MTRPATAHGTLSLGQGKQHVGGPVKWANGLAMRPTSLEIRQNGRATPRPAPGTWLTRRENGPAIGQPKQVAMSSIGHETQQLPQETGREVQPIDRATQPAGLVRTSLTQRAKPWTGRATVRTVRAMCLPEPGIRRQMPLGLLSNELAMLPVRGLPTQLHEQGENWETAARLAGRRQIAICASGQLQDQVSTVATWGPALTDRTWIERCLGVDHSIAVRSTVALSTELRPIVVPWIGDVV